MMFYDKKSNIHVSLGLISNGIEVSRESPVAKKNRLTDYFLS